MRVLVVYDETYHSYRIFIVKMIEDHLTVLRQGVAA
ncbi:MAG: hypothetical protein AVDCRST_MAG37-1972 [uncultured Rubrobacteraceae bacterium]|uniref:Uncharacterized protein n=1 Tax=uncultured Rubrobacteraceae bacterium TaxID=349277 RepID=A0A6J4QQC5_9ACTN|nr:MAG: hypothetical protein AVDCRST_MAG37-1972 [uncultured Rubrobacteraceae bacterium]